MGVGTIKKKTPSWEYVGDVYWWSNTWTCPADGFIELCAEPNASTWQWYVSDSEAHDTGWSHRMTGNSTNSATMIVFAKEGAVFGTARLTAVSTAHAYYYKFV